MEDAPKKYFRLSKGGYVRLKSAYIIQCDTVVKDSDGEIKELHCTYFPDSKSGEDTSGIKVKGVIHWVSAQHAMNAEVRLYDRLFTVEAPDGNKEKDFIEFLNPDSLQTLTKCKVEPSLKDAKSGVSFQFQRLGYFCVDSQDSSPDQLVFNRTVTLKDTWSKVQGK